MSVADYAQKIGHIRKNTAKCSEKSDFSQSIYHIIKQNFAFILRKSIENKLLIFSK